MHHHDAKNLNDRGTALYARFLRRYYPHVVQHEDGHLHAGTPGDLKPGQDRQADGGPHPDTQIKGQAIADSGCIDGRIQDVRAKGSMPEAQLGPAIGTLKRWEAYRHSNGSTEEDQSVLEEMLSKEVQQEVVTKECEESGAMSEAQVRMMQELHAEELKAVHMQHVGDLRHADREAHAREAGHTEEVRRLRAALAEKHATEGRERERKAAVRNQITRRRWREPQARRRRSRWALKDRRDRVIRRQPAGEAEETERVSSSRIRRGERRSLETKRRRRKVERETHMVERIAVVEARRWRVEGEMDEKEGGREEEGGKRVRVRLWSVEPRDARARDKEVTVRGRFEMIRSKLCRSKLCRSKFFREEEEGVVLAPAKEEWVADLWVTDDVGGKFVEDRMCRGMREPLEVNSEVNSILVEDKFDKFDKFDNDEASVSKFAAKSVTESGLLSAPVLITRDL